MPYDYDSHIIPTPKFLIFIQALTVLTAAAVIGLSSYALSFNGPDHGNGWANGVAIATVLVVGYFLLSSLIREAAPIYHRFFILLLLILGVLAWASVFISLAENIAGTQNCDRDSNGNWVCTRKSDVDGLPYKNTMIAAAALGGVVFALFVINLFTFSIHLHRARCAGAPPTYYAARHRHEACSMQNARPSKQPGVDGTQAPNYEMRPQDNGVIS